MMSKPSNNKRFDIKKIVLFSAIAAASLIAEKSEAQIYVGGHIGIRVPGARVYVGGGVPVAPAPVYAAPAPVYETPAPVYNDGYAPAPVYDDGYAPAPAVYETEYPGYAYYDYPVWNGHYRDRIYYAHYRPYFERDHRGYFNGGRFDHARFEHDRGYARGGFAHGGGYGGYGHRGRW